MRIVRDTREKTGYWEFEKFEMVNAALKTGDYTIQGLEDVLCIERKRSVSEVCFNITDDRFKRELERMKDFPYKFIILEFSIDDIMAYPVGSDIPKFRWASLKIKGPFLMSALAQIQVKYGIHVIFAGDKNNAMLMASNIMKRIYDLHTPVGN